ncbi:MAG: dephospho-CoA kinase [Christensenellales bacterium]
MKIGITGGIGSGKSTVTSCLRKLGETVICADEIARNITAPGGEGEDALRRVFGESCFKGDGTLDRAALASLVFSDREKRELLNKTLHPLIIPRVMKEAEKAPGLVFIDAALLIQTGMHNMMDAVWLITAKKQTRIKRVMRRDNIGRKSVLLRMSSQQSDGVLKKYADEIIKNNGGVKELEEKIYTLVNKIRRRAGLCISQKSAANK